MLYHFLVAVFDCLIERDFARGSPAIIVDEDELAAKLMVLDEVLPWISEVSKLEKRLKILTLDG